MKFIEDINEVEYEKFASNHAKSHFLQSYYWGVLSKDAKGLIPFYVGLIDDNGNIVCEALLLQKKLPLGYSYFYSPRGFLIDFANKELLKDFTNQLFKFIKKNKGIFLSVDPDISLNNNKEIFDNLISLKYHHLGFNKNFENRQPRYTFRLDLTKDLEEIYSNMNTTTKKRYRKGNIYDLEMKKGSISDMPLFYKIMHETSDRNNIKSFGIKYYTNFYQTLNAHNMCDMYLVLTNKGKLLDVIKEKIRTTDVGKVEQANKLSNLYDEVLKIAAEEIVLYAGLIVKYNDKYWTVHGGNSDILKELSANYLAMFETIKIAKDEGYKTLDFFGTTGDPSDSNPLTGLHNFKSSFGGEYIEFIGEFDLVNKHFLYFVFKKIIPLYHKIKKSFIKN